MTQTKIALRSAIAVATLLLVWPVHAAESDRHAMKPLHGISFDIGDERAVGYFVNENGACRLVLTMAADPELAPSSGFTSRRLEARIQAERSYRLNSTTGKILEFSCASGAEAMHVTGLAELASNLLD